MTRQPCCGCTSEKERDTYYNRMGGFWFPCECRCHKAPPTEGDDTCGAAYGTGSGTAICRRPEGHPSYAVDGIGHSPHPDRIVSRPTEGDDE